jgi:hypothetical protein
MTADPALLAREARRRRIEAIHRAAGAMSLDFTRIPQELKRLESALVRYHHQTINRKARRPMGARLLVARDLRRAVFVAIGHRLALATAQLAVSVLHEVWLADDETTYETPSDRLRGARGRIFVGDEARIGNRLMHSLMAVRTDMFAAMSADERDTLFGEVRRCSFAVSRLARLAYYEEFGNSWRHPQLMDDPWRVDIDGPSHRIRLLTFFAYRMSPDVTVSLAGSELGQGEHLCVGVADMYRALAVAGCPDEDRFAVCLAHVDLLSDLAALRDEVGHRVIANREDQPRPPLYQAHQRAGGRWVIQPVVPPLTALADERTARENRPVHLLFGAPPPDQPVTVREPHGRCPAVDILPSHSDQQRGAFLGLLRLIDAASGGRCPEVLRSRGVSAAHVSAILAVVLTEQLRADGHVTLSGQELTAVTPSPRPSQGR